MKIHVERIRCAARYTVRPSVVVRRVELALASADPTQHVHRVNDLSVCRGNEGLGSNESNDIAPVATTIRRGKTGLFASTSVAVLALFVTTTSCECRMTSRHVILETKRIFF